MIEKMHEAESYERKKQRRSRHEPF